jgi:hypothetical protein
MVLSELTRSEKLRLSQGGVTIAGIEAERAERREADSEAQRYRARGVPKTRGIKRDDKSAGHNQHFEGQKAADRRQKQKYADAKAAGKVTRVVTASDSTEIIKKGRMALAEKVLERLAEDEKEFTPKQLSQQTEKVKKASQEKKRGETKPRGPKVTTVRGTSEGPKGHSRADSLGHSDAGKFDKEGKPAKNTMDRGADKSAEAAAGRTGAASIEDINRSRSDNSGEVFKPSKESKPSKKPLVFGTSKRAIRRAVTKATQKAADKSWIDDTMSDLKPKDY